MVLTGTLEAFALLEASYVVVRILQKFRGFDIGTKDMVVAAGAEKREVTLVVASINGCRVRPVE